jgi:hypothetical protein
MHGVGNQRTRQTVKRAVFLGRSLRGQHAVLLFKRDAVRYREGKFALRSLHIDFAGLHGNLYACRHWNWFVSYT